MKAGLLALAALVAATLLFLRHCGGPDPRLVSARMRGPVVEAVLRNESGGEGDVQIDFTLRRRDGSPPLLHTQRATLRPHETARVEARIDGAHGDEQVEAEIDYPPR
jgi:hypothetical protein